MASSRQGTQYQPDFVTPPGDTLLEVLASIGMSQAELADRTGRPRKTVNRIVKGKASITPETALQLERVLRVPASFWLNRERIYREHLAREQERSSLARHLEWLKSFPVNAMVKLGWIEGCDDLIDQLREVLKFFGVASPDQWAELWLVPATKFRQSKAFESNPGAVAAWLRKGELEAQKVECEDYSEDRFESALAEVRHLTREPPKMFLRGIQSACSKAGVAVVFVPELPKTRTSGATRWLTPSKALIQLSLRYKTDDHLWFTFFHEAGHILLHGKRDVFLEYDGERDDKEREADRFSAEFLIPAEKYRNFKPTGRYYSRADILSFAEHLGIAPGIVVGRLQHEGRLPRARCNDLKVRLDWNSLDVPSPS